MAHPKQGSYARNAISIRFSTPSVTSAPFRISPSATFLIYIEIAALLFVVPTIRFASFTKPFSSVL